MRLPDIAVKDRKARQNKGAFATLIKTPGTGLFGMPASANIYLTSRAGCAAGTTAATVGTRTIKTPLLAAGARVSVGYIERGVSVTPSAGFDVMVGTGLGRSAKVGSA